MPPRTAAKRARSRTSGGEGKQEVAPAVTDEELNNRRERKRASDRAAQREHRKRQRQYVENLETQLTMIKQGSHSDPVATLVIENERLKTEVNAYCSMV